MAFCGKCGAQLPEGSKFCGVCGAPVGGISAARAAQAAPQQPAPQQPAGGGWDDFGNGYSGGYAPQTKAAPSNRTLLRVLSLVFALGFLVFALGLSGTIYFNRQVGSMVDEQYQSQREYYQKAEKEGWMTAEEAAKGIREMDKSINQAKRASARIMAPGLRKDVIGVMRATVDTLGDYDMSDYTAEEKEELRKHIEQQKENVEEQIRNMSAEEIRDQQEDLADQIEDKTEKIGFRFSWLVFGAYGTILMIVGGALALIALIAWFILGGLRGPLSETAVMPAVIACIAVSVIVIIVFGLCIATIPSKEMN